RGSTGVARGWGRSSFQSVFEGLAEVLHLGSDHHAAIALSGVVGKIIMVFILGGMECGHGHYLGHDALFPGPAAIEMLPLFLGDALLLRIGKKAHGTVLRAHITALPIAGGGIMHAPEHLQQHLERDDAGIELDPGYFHMSAITRT